MDSFERTENKRRKKRRGKSICATDGRGREGILLLERRDTSQSQKRSENHEKNSDRRKERGEMAERELDERKKAKGTEFAAKEGGELQRKALHLLI